MFPFLSHLPGEAHLDYNQQVGGDSDVWTHLGGSVQSPLLNKFFYCFFFVFFFFFDKDINYQMNSPIHFIILTSKRSRSRDITINFVQTKPSGQVSDGIFSRYSHLPPQTLISFILRSNWLFSLLNFHWSHFLYVFIHSSPFMFISVLCSFFPLSLDCFLLTAHRKSIFSWKSIY